MANIFRMDMYRLVRSVSFWVGLAVLIATTIIATFSIWYISSPEYAELMKQAIDSGATVTATVGGSEAEMAEVVALSDLFMHMDLLEYLGSMQLSGGVLALIVVLIVTLFVSGDFETGFSKNVFTAQRSRVSYFISKSLTALVIAVVYFVITMIASFIAAQLAGFDLTISPISEIVSWSLLVILILWAMSMMVTLVCWVFRSKVAAVVWGIAVTAGLIGQALQLLLALFPGCEFLIDYTLMSSLVTLGGGIYSIESSDIVRVLCVGIGFFVVYSALSIVSLKKKDV